ncbi:MAG: acyl-CoA/acyl-ACP dehydrogenase [Candidatus Eremiobacteraeota bacterium]|nr:acyl-CoA/acyl-ACP dehydrogenase [Candidatus Eremiobacteraeota bacterium]
MRVSRVVSQARDIAQHIDGIRYEDQPDAFFEAVRASDIPFLPCALANRPGKLFELTCECLYWLARASLPLTVGLTMHSYMMAGLATAPVSPESPLAKKRPELLERIHQERLLVAVSSFGDRIKAAGQPRHEIRLEPNGDGYLARGRKMFQSMASFADWITFAADLEGVGLCFFITPLKGVPELVLGDRLFGGAMAHTDTRVLDYNALAVGPEKILCLENNATFDLLHYATAWFEGLVGGAYLGAVSRAMEEARAFANQVRTPQGLTLAELDGVVVDFGKLVLRHRAALELARQFQAQLELVKVHNFRPASLSLLESSSGIKHHCAEAVNEVMGGVRALIGTRTMSPGSLLHRLNEQVVFCQLHPMMAATIERDFGAQLLNDKEFLGLDEPNQG